MAMLEKHLHHTIMPFDVFGIEGKSAAFLRRQPFEKISVFNEGDMELYETGAISRHIDEAYSDQRLQPVDAVSRARMNQIISIADSYLYPQLVWGLYVELVAKRKRDEKPSRQRVTTARQLALTYLAVLNQFIIGKDWFAGREISLADLYVAPMLDCRNYRFSETP